MLAALTRLLSCVPPVYIAKWYYGSMRSSSTKGFTLIELIVAIGLASIVITALLSFFTVFIGHQVRAQDERVALETVRFLFAELSRETYFGHDYACGQTVNNVCRCLTFKDQLGKQVKIWYDKTNKQVKRATKLFDPNPRVCDTADGSDRWVPFTDDAVSVTNLSFELENDVAKQPRVQARIDAEYTIDDSTENVSFKTQITSRILDPSQNILNTFVATSENENAAVIHNFAYGPRIDESGRAKYLKKDKETPTDNQKEADIVCRDRVGNNFLDSLCQKSAGIVATEFTSDGLYILGDNGLLFFIPQATIDDALTATGAIGDRGPVYKESLDNIQEAVVRVLGKQESSSCRFCANDPQGVVSIHPAGEYLYTRSYDGALHRVDNAVAVRIVKGGTNKETIRNIATTNNRVLLFYRDSAGIRTARLFSANTLISPDDIDGGCREFTYVPSNTQSNRCRQLHPDPDKENGTGITPSEITHSSLFRFLDALQVINDTVSLWYQDATGRHLVSIGQGASKLKRSDAVARGGIFAYGNGLNKYTSICDGGTDLCAIDSITDTTPTVISTAGTSPLTDHLHFRNLPIAINKEGRLVYFSGVQQGDTATAISVYNNPKTKTETETETNTQRILCDTVVEDGKQVAFKHLSEKHPTKEIVAAAGTSLINGYIDEIYLLEPTTSTKKQYSGNELNIVCDKDHTERYHLPTTAGPTGGLDLVRLHGVEFWESKPSTP